MASRAVLRHTAELFADSLRGLLARTLPLTAREHLVKRRVEQMIGKVADSLHGHGKNHIEEVSFRITGSQKFGNVRSLRQAP